MLNTKFLIFATVVVYLFSIEFATGDNICSGSAPDFNKYALPGDWRVVVYEKTDTNENKFVCGKFTVTEISRTNNQYKIDHVLKNDQPRGHLGYLKSAEEFFQAFIKDQKPQLRSSFCDKDAAVLVGSDNGKNYYLFGKNQLSDEFSKALKSRLSDRFPNSIFEKYSACN